MATKSISGNYPGGYYLDPAYQTLNIATTASVGGPGVTTTDAQPSTINNLGNVHGTTNGITLSAGGTITNGSGANSTAVIAGINPITVNGGAAAIANFAQIGSDAVTHFGPGTFDTTYARSILLNQGGSVENGVPGVISNGVAISGAADSLVMNAGMIGGPSTRHYAVFAQYGAYGYLEGLESTYTVSFDVAVSLQGGGKVTNTATGTIEGVTIAGAAGTVVNNGLIDGAQSYYRYTVLYPAVGGGKGNQAVGPSITLQKGGSVTNGTNDNTAAVLSNGIKISGGLGTVVNRGTIGGTSSSEYNSAGSQTNTYASIVMNAGGTVTNGSATNTTALIRDGIVIAGDAGTIVNNGRIGGPSSSHYYNSPHTEAVTFGRSIVLTAGGTIANGSTSNTAASITNGIRASGGTAIIKNFGTIEGVTGSQYQSHQLVSTSFGTAIRLAAGGSVTNGAATSTEAKITGGVVIDGAGSVTNFGTIDATAAQGIGVNLASGTIINGSATDTTALIAGDTAGVRLSAGTVVNWGTLQAVDGLAVLFKSSDCTLVEEGTGTIDGKVNGGGGTFEFAAGGGPGTLAGLGTSITHFGTVAVDKGASWTLSGTSSIGDGTTLKNAGTLHLLGQVVNSGKITNLAGAILAFDGDVGITTAALVNAGQFSNAGLVEKTAGTGTSVIRTGTASLFDTGVIDVQTGTLELAGQTVTVAGLIKGAGTIEFGPGNAFLTTLERSASIKTAGMTIAGAGAHVTVGLDLGYAGAFAAGANTELTITDGDMLLLAGSASFSGDTVDGAGRIATKGTTTLSHVIFGGTGQWLNSGMISETAQFTLGDVNGLGAVFVNQAGGVFDIAGNSGIDGTASTATFKNAGLLEKTAGAKSVIGVALVNTGTVEAASGTLDIQGAVTGNGGILKIDAGKAIQADAAVSGGQTVDFNGGNDRLILTDASHFGGKLQDFGLGDRLDLRQFDPATTTLSFAENGTNTAGVLTVTDGSLTAKITLLGQYMTSGFHTASDGLPGGTFVTYTPQAAAALATPHS